jgi:hypothetical protein
MKYILTHPTGQFQINLSEGVSLEDFKNKVKIGQDILTLFHLDDSYAGVADASFFDECKITKADK